MWMLPPTRVCSDTLGKYSKNLHIITWWFKNLQAKIWQLGKEKWVLVQKKSLHGPPTPLICCLTLFLLHRKDNQGFGKMVMNWLVHLQANSGGLTKTNMIEQHFQKYITVPSKDKIEAIFWGSNELYEIMQRKIGSYLKSEYAFQGPNWLC